MKTLVSINILRTYSHGKVFFYVNIVNQYFQITITLALFCLGIAFSFISKKI